jgi:hypothetical protein
MRTDGQTDVTKLIIAFGNFANASKHCEYFDTHYEVSAYEGKEFIVDYSRNTASGEIYNRQFFSNNIKSVQSTMHDTRSTNSRIISLASYLLENTVCRSNKN